MPSVLGVVGRELSAEICCLPTESYDLSSSDNVSDQFIFDKIDSSTVFPTCHLLMLENLLVQMTYLLGF